MRQPRDTRAVFVQVNDSLQDRGRSKLLEDIVGFNGELDGIDLSLVSRIAVWWVFVPTSCHEQTVRHLQQAGWTIHDHLPD